MINIGDKFTLTRLVNSLAQNSYSKLYKGTFTLLSTFTNKYGDYVVFKNAEGDIDEVLAIWADEVLPDSRQKFEDFYNQEEIW